MIPLVDQVHRIHLVGVRRQFVFNGDRGTATERYRVTPNRIPVIQGNKDPTQGHEIRLADGNLLNWRTPSLVITNISSMRAASFP